MTKNTKMAYKPFDQFVVRTPLNNFNHFSENKVDVSDENLKQIFNDLQLQESIYLASPSLYNSMIKWLNEKKTDKTGLSDNYEKTKESLLKYLIRMSTRSTPFGLFAGFNTGTIDEKTEIKLNQKSKNVGHLRLDMNFLVALAMDLSKSEDIRSQLRYYPNSSIYTIGNQIRYIEYFYQKSHRLHRISGVEKSVYIVKILSTAINGAKIDDLANTIVEDEILFEEAEAFIYSLIDAQILISELEPAVTGQEFLYQILHKLKTLEKSEEIKKSILQMEKIQDLINQLYNDTGENRINIYDQIEQSIIETKTKFEKKFLFQLDLVKSCEKCTVSKEIPQRILETIPVLGKLSVTNHETKLQKFKKAFRERYEDEEIPLLMALDTETGLGYMQNMNGDNSPLVGDLLLRNKSNGVKKINWHPVYSMLLKKYHISMGKGARIIELVDEDFHEIEENSVLFPNTMASIVQLFKEPTSEETIIYIKSFGGSSAVNLIGRFCHADSETYQHAQNIANKDQELCDNILAEICHLPESRTGNILLRPSLRKYEIPYLAKANVEKKNQILPNDLLISVRNNKIVLRSKSLNREIIPRNSTAHNFYNNSLPVYHFLSDLQTQDLNGGLFFSWGPLEKEFDYFPRVMYKNLIFSLETWIINKKDLSSILKIKEEENRLIEFKNYLENKGVAQKVILADGDNELYIDLENFEMLSVLFKLVKKRRSFKLQEFLFDKNNLIINGPDGGYTNEFIFSFYKYH